jgi:TonB family protein
LIKLVLISVVLISFQISAQKDSVITYFDNGKIKSIVHINDKVRDGEAKFYWENGKLKEVLSYVNGRVEGLVRRYDENGIIREMFTIEKGKREGPTSLFDSTGTYIKDIDYEEGILVVDKIVLDSGIPKTEPEKTQTTPTQVIVKKKKKSDDLLPPDIEAEKNYEDDPAFYKTVEVMPEPYGGMEAIYRKIGYPKEAKEDKIEGVVKVLTFIDRDGEVIDAQVVEGIGHGCDEAARLAILYHRFKPGLIKGQKVKVQIIIPIEFKLPKDN